MSGEKKYKTVSAFLRQADIIRREVDCILSKIEELLQDRELSSKSDGAMAEKLRQIDVLNSTARGGMMRLKQLKQDTAFVSYLLDENKIQENAEPDSNSEKEQGR